MIEVRNPVNQFFDADGSPLDAGYIYIGTTGANPETSPQTIYWDKAGAIPAAQPLRTLNGYPARDGAVSKFYTATKNYSITVKDKRGILVQSVLNSDSGVFDELSDVSSAALLGYSNTVSGLVATDVQDAIDEVQSNIDTIDSQISSLQSSFSGVVNLFSNGAFLINQRGYVSGVATGAANQYTLDRLRVVVSGQNLVFTAAPFGNKITAPAGGAEQVIEGAFIVGGDYACTWTGTGTVTVNGSSFGKNETFTLPANSNATIRLVGEFEKFMLTRPDMIGRYEYDYSHDISKCFRYYETGEGVRGAPYVRPAGVTTSDPTCFATVQFKVRKRATPTMTGGPAFATISAWPDIGVSSATAQLLANNAAGEAKLANWQASAEF